MVNRTRKAQYSCTHVATAILKTQAENLSFTSVKKFTNFYGILKCQKILKIKFAQ